MFSKDEKQNIAKIKKLIRIRDFEKIEMKSRIIAKVYWNCEILDDFIQVIICYFL